MLITSGHLYECWKFCVCLWENGKGAGLCPALWCWEASALCSCCHYLVISEHIFLSLIPWYTWANAQECVRRANRSGRAWSFCPPDLEAGASSWQQHLAVAAEERALGDLFSCGCERGCCAFWGETGWLGRRKIRFGSNTVTAEQEPIPCLVFVEPWSLWWPLVLW